MISSDTKPHVTLSKAGDVLIIQEQAKPVLFSPQPFVEALLNAPKSAIAISIEDVGAAAIRTLISAGAIFEAKTSFVTPSIVEAITLRFTLANSLVVAYTTDDTLVLRRDQLAASGINLVVTDSSIDWRRQDLQLIGEVISPFSVPRPRIVRLRQYGVEAISRLVCCAIDRQRESEALNEGKL